MSLSALGISDPNSADFESIAEPSAKAAHARNFTRPLEAADLIAAMVSVEKLFGAQQLLKKTVVRS